MRQVLFAAVLTSARFLGGCSAVEGPEDVGADEKAATSVTVDGVTFQTLKASLKVKATTQPTPAELADLTPEEIEAATYCLADYDYLQVQGTRFDGVINALLSKGVPEARSYECDQATTQLNSAHIKFTAKGFLAVEYEGAYSFAGANGGGEIATDHLNIDLTTGKRLTLDEILAPSAKPILLRTLRRAIARQTVKERDASGRLRDVPLDQDSKDALTASATRLFAGSLADVETFTLAQTGIVIDVASGLPHAVAGASGAYLVPYASLRANMAKTAVAARLVR